MKHIANIMRHQYGKDEMTVGRIYESGRGKRKTYTAQTLTGELIAQSNTESGIYGLTIADHPMNFNRPI